MDRKEVIEQYLGNVFYLSSIIKLYDYFIEGKIIQTSTSQPIDFLRILRDGKIITHGLDGFIEIQGNMLTQKVSQNQIFILPDDRIAIIVEFQNFIAIINPETTDYDIVFREHLSLIKNQLNTITVNNEYRVITSDEKYTLIWNPNTGEVYNKYLNKGGNFLCQLSNDEILLHEDNYLRIYNMNLRLKRDFAEEYDVKYAQLIDKHLITVSNSVIKKWDLQTRMSEIIYSGAQIIKKIYPIKEYYIILVLNSRNIIFNLKTKRLHFAIANYDYISMPLFLPDGRVAIPLNNKVHIYDFEERRFVMSLLADEPKTQVGIFPDGHILISSHDKDLEIYRVYE